MSALATTNYDPLGQNITILDSSETPFNVSIADINYEAHYTLSVATCYAVQLGASAVMLIAVLILTRKPGNHAVFILNVASLVLCFFSRLVFILFFASNFNTFYSLNTFDYRYVTAGDNALVTIGSIIPVFLTATINASLVLQVIGITRQSHFRPWINKLMVGFSAFLFLFSLIFRIILAVENVLEIFKQSNFVAERWLTQIVLASETVTIMWFCGIFSGKLIVMLWVRSKTIWGRQIFLEVIVIGLFYTMFLPTIFAIVQMAQPSQFPEAGSFYLALTAILLPLTSLWAQNVKQNEENTKRSELAASNNKKLQSSLWADRSGCCPTCGNDIRNTSISTADGSRRGSAGHMVSSRRASKPMHDSIDEIDLECQELSQHDVNVTNTVRVESRPA